MNAQTRTLNFHGIGVPGPDIEPSERPYWISVAFFDQLVDMLAQPNARHLFITFDDGNRSDLEIAAPRLANQGLEARFFVLSGRLERPGYLSPNDLTQLQQMGFQIGSHGQDHVNWAQLPADQLKQEVRSSRQVLEKATGRSITEAAIPFGSYNRAVLTALRDAGYQVAWTSDGGNMDPNRFLRPRLSVRNDMTLDYVRHALFAPIPALRQLRRSLAMARKRVM
ncbi:MAG: polysaccharide deacetylase family protein [Sedimentitalea sp.]